jgi:hypothetical protein
VVLEYNIFNVIFFVIKISVWIEERVFNVFNGPYLGE